MHIDKRALDLANCLLDIETKSKIRKNKRSPSDIDKFIKSTQWLSKRILSNYAASKNAPTRLARDKNRYKANSHNIDGLSQKVYDEHNKTDYLFSSHDLRHIYFSFSFTPVACYTKSAYISIG